MDAKEHILYTSLVLFLQKGFKEVTMKEIVEHTALSKGAFYHYFPSKEAVFAEVVRHYIEPRMTLRYPHFNQDSLQAFYTGILAHYEAASGSDTLFTASGKPVPALTDNYFYLIFDAMRLLPGFKELQLQQQQEELEAWEKVVAAARKNKEIQTPMTDEQVALLFIYLGDGCHLNQVMNTRLNPKKNTGLQQLWNGLYQTLQP